MRQIETVEEWKGQDVVDPEGERVGRLDDVWFRPGEPDPVLISVKSGLLGRRHRLVPLQDATFSREFVRVAFPKRRTEDAPQVEGGARLSPADLVRVLDHYGVDVDGPTDIELESGASRSERLRAAEEAVLAADEAEAVAARAEDDAVAADRRAEEARADADAARVRSLEARERARELRHRADAALAGAPPQPAEPGPEA